MFPNQQHCRRPIRLCRSGSIAKISENNTSLGDVRVKKGGIYRKNDMISISLPTGNILELLVPGGSGVHAQEQDEGTCTAAPHYSREPRGSEAEGSAARRRAEIGAPEVMSMGPNAAEDHARLAPCAGLYMSHAAVQRVDGVYTRRRAPRPRPDRGRRRRRSQRRHSAFRAGRRMPGAKGGTRFRKSTPRSVSQTRHGRASNLRWPRLHHRQLSGIRAERRR